MCIATFEELGITLADRKILNSMGNFMASLVSVIDDTSGPLSEHAQAQLGLQGLPVEDSNNVEISTIVSIHHGDIPVHVFQLPKGLKERSLSKFDKEAQNQRRVK